MSTKLDSLEKLFERELQDLYSAENQLMAALPQMQSEVTDTSLRKAIEDYQSETTNHIERLTAAFAKLGLEPGGVKCTGTEGLIDEFKSLLKDEVDPKVLDCAIIATVRRIQHHQIAGYGITYTFADQLGHHEIAENLRKSLSEQEAADKAVAALGVRWVNVVAAQA